MEKIKRKLTKAEEFFLDVYVDTKCKTSDKYIVQSIYKDDEGDLCVNSYGTNELRGAFHVSYSIENDLFDKLKKDPDYKKVVLVPVEIINKFLIK